MPDCLIGLPVIFLQVESAHYTEDFFSTCDIQGMLNSVDNSGVTASGNDEEPLRQETKRALSSATKSGVPSSGGMKSFCDSKV
jgi:hypothetical protein